MISESYKVKINSKETEMRLLILLVALALTGCGHIVTLYPRGGGEQATGTLNDGSRNMNITLKGTTYSGQFVRGQTFGFGIGQSFGSRPAFGTSMMVGSSNQSSALLRSGPACLNNISPSFKWTPAGCQRCRVIHGGERRLRRTQSRGG